MAWSVFLTGQTCQKGQQTSMITSSPTLAEKLADRSGETKEQYQTIQPAYDGGPIVFDVETMPLPESIIRERSAPFTPPKHPGEFDRSAIKTGNLKDPDKIAAKIEEAKQAHTTLVENYAKDCARLESEYWANIIERATLNPMLGRVLAIGIGFVDGSNHYLALNDPTDENEAGMLEEWWNEFYGPCWRMGYSIIGHNIHEFDIPFLVKRSWMLGVDMPDVITRGRYLDDQIVDTSKVWQCGSRGGDYIKLDTLGKVLGCGGKLDEVDSQGNKIGGGDFHRLYFGSSEDRGKAMDYLEADVELTRKVAGRLGLL